MTDQSDPFYHDSFRRAHCLSKMAFDYYNKHGLGKLPPVELFIASEYEQKKENVLSELVMSVYYRTTPQMVPFPMAYWMLLIEDVCQSTHHLIQELESGPLDNGHFIFASFKRVKPKGETIITGLTAADPCYAVCLSSVLPGAGWVYENPRYYYLRKILADNLRASSKGLPNGHPNCPE